MLFKSYEESAVCSLWENEGARRLVPEVFALAQDGEKFVRGQWRGSLGERLDGPELDVVS